jgi:protein-S-isoprenylcysteine O-methyltransferase Ste14
MQTFYSFTHDRRALDLAMVWSDAFLHARNDPTNGRIIWTGKRDLCWPNKATNDVQAFHAGAENGDVIEHIVNTARLILEDPAVWNQTAPPDPFGLGVTCLDRAKTYVRECQRSADTTIVPWFVRRTKDGYRLYHPDSPAYLKCCGDNGPVPWNQQQELAGALLRLAQCHRLLNDGDTNIAYYEKITTDAADWFFASALPVSAHNRVCYQWAYVAPRDPADWPEVTTESDYDMFIFRAFQANLGPTRLQMQRLINTARFVMYLGTNRIAGKVNGTSNTERHERQFLEFEWIEMSVLDRESYHLMADTVLTSHEYYENLAVEAAVLSAKHYWATHASLPEPQEILDPAKLPPLRQASPLIALVLRHTSRSLVSASRTPAATMLLLWIVSGLGLIMAKRFNLRAARHDPLSGFITLMYLTVVALGVFVALQLPAARALWPGIVFQMAVFLFGLGLALQWYACIQPLLSVKANVAGSAEDRLIVRYRFIRNLSVGGLLAMIGLSLSFENWASLLIMCVPCCALTLLRIRAARTDGKNRPRNENRN